MKRHGLPAAALVLVMAVAMAGLTAAPDQLTLRLRLEKGRTYGAKMISAQKVTQSLMGQDQVIIQTVGFGYRLEVTAVDPAGVMTVQCTYDSCRFKQEGPLGAVEYDSANPPEWIPETAQGFAALVGLGFTVRLEPNGRTVDLAGLDTMIARMLDRMGLSEQTDKDQIAQTLKTQYGSESMKRSLGNIFIQYPEQPLGAGASWTREVRVTEGFPMILAGTYTLTGRKGGVAALKVHATVAPNKEAPPQDLQGMKMRYELAGEQDGTMEIDEATGLPLRAVFRQKLAGQVTATMGPGKADTMTFPIAIEGETRIEGRRK